MEDVTWGEFKIGDLFEKQTLRFKRKASFNKGEDISRIKTIEFNLPLVNAKDGDNGIMYYGRESDFEHTSCSIDIVNDGAISTGNVYSQPQKTGVLYNAYLIKQKEIKQDCSYKLLHFFTTSIFKSIKTKYGYENKASWTKVKNEKIKLPTKNGKIDFCFMETFIKNLEFERIAELDKYLDIKGLSDYTLTNEELKALDNYSELEFKNFNVIDIFNVKNSGNILSRNIVENSGNTPYLCAGREDNSVSSYINYDEKYLDKGNCVFIGGKTFVVSYQKEDFYSNDSHNLILSLKDNKIKNEATQLYLVTCIEKSLGYKYSWGDSISNRKIQTDEILLPIKNEQPDFYSMNILISAVKKLVIKDVVLYTNEKVLI